MLLNGTDKPAKPFGRVQEMSDQGALPLPMTLEEITPAWLTSALRTRAPDATVRDCEIVKTYNTTGTIVWMKLDLDEAAKKAGIPEHVVLKGGFEPHSRRKYHLHNREARGYNEVLGPLKLPSPRFFFAQKCDEQRQGIVILEDLGELGVDFCDATRPQTFEHSAMRLTDLARFHAQTWNSPELDDGRWSWVERGARVFRKRFYDEYAKPDVWKAYCDAPRGAATSVRFHDLAWASDAMDRIVRLSDSLPHAVLHGDAHLGNTFIDRNGRPGFYDPNIHRDHVMRDVAYHLVGALDTADRARWEGALLQHYLEELRRNGVDAPSYDEMYKLYCAYLVFAFIIWLVNDVVFQPEPINTANTARFSAALIDHDAVNVLYSLT